MRRHRRFERIPRIRPRLAVVMAALFLAIAPSAAQQSANYKLNEHVFNGGGNPDGGPVLASPNFRATIDSIAEGVLGTYLSSPGFKADGGFTAAYPPPGEVYGLRLDPDHITLTWNPDWTVGMYNLYRDLLSSLPGGGYGTCKDFRLVNETTTDTDVPPTGEGFFYLVTAENRLEQEGTKGLDSHGVERPNPSACP